MLDTFNDVIIPVNLKFSFPVHVYVFMGDICQVKNTCMMYLYLYVV